MCIHIPERRTESSQRPRRLGGASSTSRLPVLCGKAERVSALPPKLEAPYRRLALRELDSVPTPSVQLIGLLEGLTLGHVLTFPAPRLEESV